MTRSRLHADLYLLNLALLFTHEIDSAFWKEWDLFGLPGGIQLFLVLNFSLLVVALLGFRWLLEGRRSGYLLSCLLAASGAFAFAIHGFFLAAGHPEFRLPVSLLLLGVILLTSLAQGLVAVRGLRQAEWRAEGRHG